jgi:hypothetical protein
MFLKIIKLRRSVMLAHDGLEHYAPSELVIVPGTGSIKVSCLRARIA